ncbi:MAG TPA: hypothetical protein VHC90_22090, partial [Bryobacteraceae bacterium]|nr:hypothetical protein [Bryobacteraceae bacterium]
AGEGPVLKQRKELENGNSNFKRNCRSRLAAAYSRRLDHLRDGGRKNEMDGSHAPLAHPYRQWLLRQIEATHIGERQSACNPSDKSQQAGGRDMTCEVEILKTLEELHRMVTLTEYAFAPENVMAAVVITRAKGDQK